MIDRFQVPKPLYPLISVFAATFILVGALLLAKSDWGVIFCAGVFLLLCVFGYARPCFKLLPFLTLYLAFFSVIFYFSSGGDWIFVGQMAIRLAGLVIAAIPGLALPPVNLVRNLTSLHFPRLVTLGMLITLSFVPVLANEVKKIRAAMRTRGVTNVLHPTSLYRAFLIPLIAQIVNISDTLALSVETRGFISDDGSYSVYEPVAPTIRDFIFLVFFFILLIGGLVLKSKGVELWTR